MSEDMRCIVCDEAADETISATCNSCEGRFHLNQRNDDLAKDCGTVWVNEQYLALEFACQRCLDGIAPAPPKPGIVRPRLQRRRYRKRA